MPKLERRNFVPRLHRLASATLGLAITLTSVAVASQPAQAQTFKVLYGFTGGSDGGEPDSGLITDSDGNLYGTTALGGVSRDETADGVVFEVGPNGGESVLTTFSSFDGGAAGPIGPLARDLLGNLYGVTGNSGTHGGGTVFEVFTTGGRKALHVFGRGGAGDGAHPAAGVILDKKGNLYGTTTVGGTSDFGVVFKLHVKPSKETILHTFTGQKGDGVFPSASVIRDAAGNVYGTTEAGGTYGGVCGSAPLGGCGIVFKINTHGKETVLYRFGGAPDGANPGARLLRDPAGNLYGTTYYGGSGGCQYGSFTGCGTIFKLDKNRHETILYSFTGGTDGGAPSAGLIRDAAGNLYGTTFIGGGTGCLSQLGCGTVFELDATGKETVLYRFTGGADGENPKAELLRDMAGNLYGTTLRGAGGDKKVCSLGCGVVFKITP
jgi:uncharacterized repeat protein (TIGR03803 family)